MTIRRLFMVTVVLAALLGLAAGCAQKAPQPQAKVDPLEQGVKGEAIWYGMMYQGRTTTSGEPFDLRKLTASHASLPYGTRLEVINPANGKSVVVVINDRSHLERGNVLALSKAAADALGLGDQRRFLVLYRYAK